MLINAEQLNAYPPFVVAALARDGRHALTMQDISNRCGMPLRTVCRIAAQLSWNDINLLNIVTFCKGCNFDLRNTNKQRDYLRKTATVRRKFSHLSPVRRRAFERRILAWQKLQSSG